MCEPEQYLDMGYPAPGDLQYHTWRSAVLHFGPGWRDIVSDVFDVVALWPGSVYPVGVRLGRCRDGRLQAVADSDGFATTEEWLVLQSEIWTVCRRTYDVCEACGATSFRPDVQRSTRVHCFPHALDWAAGLPESTVWASAEGWRAGTSPWEPGRDEEPDVGW